MRLTLVLLLLFFGNCLKAQSPAKIYIEKFDSLAIEVYKMYQIPPSLVLGIALHESGSGTSKLCRVNHNHFGVKGKVKSSKTKSGYSSHYRSFESDQAAYLHFGEMLSSKKFYAGLKGDMDYKKWLKAMKSSRYAMSSTWVSQVDKIIRKYGLTQYDITVTQWKQTIPDAPVVN